MSDSPWPTTTPEFRGPSEPKTVSLHDALPPGTRIDEFEIAGVLGTGAFGIVYLARDRVLLRQVAIKEYMPATLAGRRHGLPVSLRSPEFATAFERGLESFLSEAQLLASFDHPSLVKVHRFWKGNGTAYMAMQYYPGDTLKDVRLRMERAPDDAWVLALLEPLLGVLELLHSHGVLHRDVSPDNILILPEGRPVLLDLGSARRVIGTATAFLTTLLKPPFAPLEQYAHDADGRQGPWTDLYSLGATLHFVLEGHAPTPSVVRAVDDVLPPLASAPHADRADEHERLLATVDWLLALAPDARPREVESVRRALRGELVPPAVPRAAGSAADAARTAPSPLPMSPRTDGSSVETPAAPAPEQPSQTSAAASGAAAAADDASRNADGGSGSGNGNGGTSADASGSGNDRDNDNDSIKDHEPAPRERARRDPRPTVALMAFLGLAVLLTGAWTLNGAGRTSPALASLASALRSSSSPHAATASTLAPASPRPAARTAPAAPIAIPAQTVASLQTPAVAPTLVASSPAPIEAASAVPIEATADASPAPARAAARRAARARATVHPVARGQVQNVTARAKPGRAAEACDPSGVLAQFMCAIRRCNSPRTNARPECARSRQIEEARLRRAERL